MVTVVARLDAIYTHSSSIYVSPRWSGFSSGALDSIYPARKTVDKEKGYISIIREMGFSTECRGQDHIHYHQTSTTMVFGDLLHTLGSQSMMNHSCHNQYSKCSSEVAWIDY